jgi:hypothetical protein
MPTNRTTTILVWCVLSGLAGIGLLALEVLVGAGGHGPRLPLTVTFPYGEILYRMNPSGSRWLLILATLIQFPVYALICRSASEKKLRVLAACGLVILHGIAVWACFLPREFYERFW